MRRRAAFLSLLATAAIVIGCAGRDEPSIKIVIPAGATMHVAAESLASKGVIPSAGLFRTYAAILRRDRDIGAGTYLLHRNMGWNRILDALHGGKGRVEVITIPEGFSLAQITQLLVTRLGISVDSIQAAARDTALLERLDIPSPSVEGYLFPDTYTFPAGTTARVAIDAMVRQFEQVWRPEWTARLESIPMTRHQLLTLASLVETEAKISEERAVIAAVYMNRLRAGMRLQSDPTIQYALGEHQSRLFYRQLGIKSPYNTYRNSGLPPGPIASPGRASIIAALYPAAVPYKFFVAFPDGHHEFHVDFETHALAVARARRAWDSLEVRRR